MRNSFLCLCGVHVLSIYHYFCLKYIRAIPKDNVWFISITKAYGYVLLKAMCDQTEIQQPFRIM